MSLRKCATSYYYDIIIYAMFSFVAYTYFVGYNFMSDYNYDILIYTDYALLCVFYSTFILKYLKKT